MDDFDNEPGIRLWDELSAGGPVTDDPGYFNRMSRSAWLVTDDLLELRSYNDMRIRVGLWLFGLLALVLAGTSGIFFDRSTYPFEDQVKAFRMLTDYHGVLTEQYRLQPDSRALDEYLASYDEIRPLHRNHAIRELILSMMFTGPFWLLALLWPRRAPLRLDRQRGVAYTILKGELAVSRIASLEDKGIPPFFVRTAAPPPLTYKSDPRIYHGFGPGLTGLMGTRSGKKRIFWMGAQPATNLSQNSDLGDLASCFANNVNDHKLWVHLLRRRRFLPGDILRALDRWNLRRSPDLDDPALQARLELAIPNAMPMGDPLVP